MTTISKRYSGLKRGNTVNVGRKRGLPHSVMRVTAHAEALEWWAGKTSRERGEIVEKLFSKLK